MNTDRPRLTPAQYDSEPAPISQRSLDSFQKIELCGGPSRFTTRQFPLKNKRLVINVDKSRIQKKRKHRKSNKINYLENLNNSSNL